MNRLLVGCVAAITIAGSMMYASPKAIAAASPTFMTPADNPVARRWAVGSSGPSVLGGSSIAQYALMFGGCGGQASCPSSPDGGQTMLADTWIWTGGSWLKVPLGGLLQPVAPPARWGAVMTYDAASKRSMLFGGCCAVDPIDPGRGVLLDDTWIFDWNTCSVLPTPNPRPIVPSTCRWTKVTTAVKPPARALAAMAEDSAGGAILYGGYSGSTPALALSQPRLVQCGEVRADTWRWNWTTLAWTQKAAGPDPCQRGGVIGKPLPVWGHAMARATAPGSPMLYGGVVADGVSPLPDMAGGELVSEVWFWNGSTWAPLNTDTSSHTPGRCFANQHVMCSPPGAVWATSLFFDETRNVTSLYGGCGGGYADDCRTYLGRGWTWNGTAWATSAGQLVAPQRDSAAAAGGRLPMVFGGRTEAPGFIANDTHILGATRWLPSGAWEPSWIKEQTLNSAGYPTWDYPSTFEPPSDEGWLGDGGTPLETRVWHSTGPVPRWGAAMLDDGERVVMFGGRDERTLWDLNDTWIRRGAAWINMSPGSVGYASGTPAAPAPRASAGFVSIGDRKAILFGGASKIATAGCCPNDPTVCTSFCENYFNDVWLWDGNAFTWSQVSTSGPSPQARKDAAVSYDPAARALVVYGGSAAHPNDEDERGPASFAETWVLRLSTSGTTGTWSVACDDSATTSAPSCPMGGRDGAIMAYHPDAKVMVLHGGTRDWIFWADTWVGSVTPTGFHWSEEHLCYDYTNTVVDYRGNVNPEAPEPPLCFPNREEIAHSSPFAYDPVSRRMLAFGGFALDNQTCTIRNMECTLRALSWYDLQVGSGLSPGSTAIVLAAPSPPQLNAGDRLVLSGGKAEVAQVLGYEPATRTVVLEWEISESGHTDAHVLEWSNDTPAPVRPCTGCHTYSDNGVPHWWASPGQQYAMAFDRTSDEMVLFGGNGVMCYSELQGTQTYCPWGEPLGGTMRLPRAAL